PRTVRGRRAILLLTAGVAIPALLIWGAVFLLAPERDTDPPPDPRVQGPLGAAPPGPGAPPPPEGEILLREALAGLDASNYWTRKTALEGLATMSPNDERQRAMIARKLVELVKVDDRNRQIRSLAVKALGVWGREAEVPALTDVIEYPPDPFVRREA